MLSLFESNWSVSVWMPNNFGYLKNRIMRVVMTGVQWMLVNENNGMIVVQECNKCLSEIVH